MTVLSTNNAWIQKSNFAGTSRWDAVGFSIGMKGYIGTGNDASGIKKKDFWEWDPASNVWTQKADFGGTARLGAIGFSIGTKGYIGTGDDGVYPLANHDFWEWDQNTNTWLQKANFVGMTREFAVGFSIGGKGYIGTGSSDGGVTCYSDFWEWDQATDTWAQKANFGGMARWVAVGFSIGTKGYIGTGSTNSFGNNGGYKDDFWEWDQISDTWTQKANFSGSARANAVGFSIGTMGYIGTGSNVISKSDFWEYDQTTDTWLAKPDFSGAARVNAIGMSVGNKGYIGTGWIGSSTNDFWEYTPTNNCTVSANLDIIMIPCTLSLQMKLFLEGFYSGNGSMIAVADRVNYPTLCDTITVELHNANSPFELVYSAKGTLDIHGNGSFVLPASVLGNSYYIAIRHRNALETWSSAPVLFNSLVKSYDFSLAADKAYDDNQVIMVDGKYALFSGDVNQDGTVDILDMSITDNDATAFAFGYNASDSNGDGASDILDMTILDNNSKLFLFIARPY